MFPHCDLLIVLVGEDGITDIQGPGVLRTPAHAHHTHNELCFVPLCRATLVEKPYGHLELHRKGTLPEELAPTVDFLRLVRMKFD